MEPSATSLPHVPAAVASPLGRETYNQAQPLAEHDAFARDSALAYWLGAFHPNDGDGWRKLHEIGQAVGGHHLQNLADRANRKGPELATFSRTGERLDDVAFDPAWDELLAYVADSGICGLTWADGAESGYLARAAAFELFARLDIGVLCPISMTTAAVPVFFANGARDGEWPRRLAFADPAQALAGMAMTEPQGGSDLAGSTTLATPDPDAAAGDDAAVLLHGRKWFCSHPVADVLLVLARESGDVSHAPNSDAPAADHEAGDSSAISCFVVPGWRADGSRNGIELLRLKDKLGTRSLASAEIAFRGAHGRRIGARGEGVKTIMAMVTHTRLDCAAGSTGIITRAVTEAIGYCAQRRAFGARLVEQPLMQMVLADLALEREAALALTMEASRATAAGDDIARILTILGKYWITRRAVSVAIEAVESLGGNGYIEDWVLARLYRDAQVNSTWEGSGNVIVLDLFRAISRNPTLLGQLTDRIDELTAGGSVGDELSDTIHGYCLAGPFDVERGRAVVGRLALATQAALLVWRADQTGDRVDGDVARAFVATRLQHVGDRVFGAGGEELAAVARELIDRYDVTGLV